MNNHLTPKAVRLAAVAVLVAMLAALPSCTPPIEGTYEGEDNAMFHRLIFKPDGKVQIIFLNQTLEATYEYDGRQVTITHEGDVQVLTRDNQGCLDGDVPVGKYCKR